MITSSCEKPDHDPVATIFEKRLEALNFSYELRDDGRYDVNFGGEQTSTVSLQNKQREFARDQDPEIIHQFIDQIKRSSEQSDRSWEDVKPFLRYQLDGDEYNDLPDETVFEPVADGLIKIYVYVSSDGELISWITDDLIEKWDTDFETIQAIAELNMNALVEETTLEIEEIDGVPLGMLSIESGGFKASLILTSGLKDLVIEKLGYPVYAVVPDRDFVYLIPTEHMAFLGRLGPVVREQYKESSYPITNKVLEISDQGISISGTFKERE